MLKSVPMGQSVDVVLRRGYPMLYNPDGCPKQSLETVRMDLLFVPLFKYRQSDSETPTLHLAFFTL